MGGKAIIGVRPLLHNELIPTFEYVKEQIIPLLLINKDDIVPLGSFLKKPINETSGDIDIALDITSYLNEGLKFEEIPTVINHILTEQNIENVLLKGFDQVSIKVPICGIIENGYAQVDLIPTNDLQWAKFMYHSPNIAENESKYKGAVRNALLMALVSEPSKHTSKIFEGKVEEYNSYAIRFPTGMWDIKRSFKGKTGIIKKGIILESKFITNSPQEIINVALGEGFKIDSANSFETLWEIIHRKNYVYKSCLNEIMTKFLYNLKSMQQEIPYEFKIKYPSLCESVFKPKSEKEINDAIKTYSINLGKSLNIDPKIIELLTIESYKFDHTDRLKVHWFSHPNISVLEGGNISVNKYNTLQDITHIINGIKSFRNK